MLSSYIALSVVFGLLGGFLVLLKRWEKRQATGRILRVVETVPLGSGKTLSVVHAAGRRLVLGATNERITLISELPAEEPTAAESAPKANGSLRQATQAPSVSFADSPQ